MFKREVSQVMKKYEMVKNDLRYTVLSYIIKRSYKIILLLLVRATYLIKLSEQK